MTSFLGNTKELNNLVTIPNYSMRTVICIVNCQESENVIDVSTVRAGIVRTLLVAAHAMEQRAPVTAGADDRDARGSAAGTAMERDTSTLPISRRDGAG